MNEFLRRVRRLQEQCSGKKKASVILVYADGTEKACMSLDAVSEIINDHSIVDVKCADETGQSLLRAILESEQETDGDLEGVLEL